MADRIWDQFLTAQDRSVLAARQKRRIGYGKYPALLLVDLYRWVFGDRPEPILAAIKTWPGSCGLAAWNAIPHIQALLKTAREAGIPIIHVTGLEGAGIEEWSARHKPGRSGELSPGDLERRSRRYDIVDEVAPLPGEAVLRKSSPSAFWGTPLVGHLNFLSVDTILTCGESTSGCVRSTVVDGCTYRFRMVVVEECVFDRSEAAHAMNLFDMDQKYADVLPVAEVLRYLRAWQTEQRVTKEAPIIGHV